MKHFLFVLCGLLWLSTSQGKETFNLALEIYRLPIVDRIAVGDLPAADLVNVIKEKGAKLVHRGALSAGSGTRCVYEDGATVTILSDWDRNDKGELVPIFSKELVGVTAEFDVFVVEERMASVAYTITYNPKPPTSVRSGVTLKDRDATMEFNYEVPVIPQVRAVGSFTGPRSGSRVLYESADDATATVVLLHYNIKGD